MYTFVSRRAPDRATAEDITSDVFHQALAHLRDFEWRGVPFVAWLFRIASNALADRWRRDARESQHSPADVPDTRELDELERRVILYQLVDRLPDVQRRVIQMRFVEERSIREIASALGRSEGAVKQRRDATAALSDRELAPLARLAGHLRHYPGPEFKSRLRANLERRTAMSAALVTAHIREGFTTITPYLHVREAGLVDFLAGVFGAEETFRTRGSAGGMHREVRIGNSMLMIGEGGGEEVMPVSPAALHVYVEDAGTTFDRAIAAGATSLGAPADRPYGERAGFVRDPFGNHWYIATHLGGSHVPEGLRTVTPFVHAPAAPRYIEFLKSAFGAVEEGRHDSEGRVRYARLRIGDAAIELGEAEGGAELMPTGFYLYVGNPDMLYEQALSAGAKSLWPPADQPYGDRMGGVEDPIGNQWFIARPA